MGSREAMEAEGVMGSEGVIGAEEDKGAAIYLMLDSQDTTGIGYMALWGLGAKCLSGWMEWSGVDTPQTVTTTRAPAVLTNVRALKISENHLESHHKKIPSLFPTNFPN